MSNRIVQGPFIAASEPPSTPDQGGSGLTYVAGGTVKFTFDDPATKNGLAAINIVIQPDSPGIITNPTDAAAALAAATNVTRIPFPTPPTAGEQSFTLSGALPTPGSSFFVVTYLEYPA